MHQYGDCSFCGGEVKSETVELDYRYKGKLYVFQGVPAGVCQLVKDSDVLVDQILAWDNELFREDLGILPEALREEIRGAVTEFLDLA